MSCKSNMSSQTLEIILHAEFLVEIKQENITSRKMLIQERQTHQLDFGKQVH